MRHTTVVFLLLLAFPIFAEDPPTFGGATAREAKAPEKVTEAPCVLTKGEQAYWEHAKKWGLSEADFQRLRIAWTVTRKSTDAKLSIAIGNRCGQLGQTVMDRLRSNGLGLGPDDAIEVDMLYRECCAELLLNINNLEEEKKIVLLWLKTMRV